MKVVQAVCFLSVGAFANEVASSSVAVPLTSGGSPIEVAPLTSGASPLDKVKVGISLPTIWGSAKDAWAVYKCRNAVGCEACRDAGCNMCATGSVGRTLLSPGGLGYLLNAVVPSAIMNHLSEEEKTTGEICGFPKDYCEEVSSWWESLSDLSIPFVGSVQDIIKKYMGDFEGPQFNPCGDPAGAEATLLLLPAFTSLLAAYSLF